MRKLALVGLAFVLNGCTRLGCWQGVRFSENYHKGQLPTHGYNAGFIAGIAMNETYEKLKAAVEKLEVKEREKK